LRSSALLLRCGGNLNLHEPSLFQALLHLAKMCLCGSLIAIRLAGRAPLHQILNIWYVLKMRSSSALKSASGSYLTGLPRPSLCRTCWIGVKSKFSNNSLGEPVSFVYSAKMEAGSPKINLKKLSITHKQPKSRQNHTKNE